MQTHKTTAISTAGAVSGLAKLIKETDKLLKARKLLPDIRIWHARCQGRLRRLFPDKPEVEQYWANIELKWRIVHQASIVDETFYDTLDQSGQSTYGEEIEKYIYYCSDSLIFLRETLLRFIVLAEAGEINATKVYEDLPNPRRNSPDIGLINDSNIKKLCQQHIYGAMASLEAKAFIPAAIQIGAALKGILYGFACQYSDQAKSAKAAQKKVPGKDEPVVDSLDKWTLDRLLAVAAELEWISKDGGHKLGIIVRDYRNFVHPGRYLGSDTTLDDDAVNASWCGLLKIVSELQEWVKSHQDSPAWVVEA